MSCSFLLVFRVRMLARSVAFVLIEVLSPVFDDKNDDKDATESTTGGKILLLLVQLGVVKDAASTAAAAANSTILFVLLVVCFSSSSFSFCECSSDWLSSGESSFLVKRACYSCVNRRAVSLQCCLASQLCAK